MIGDIAEDFTLEDQDGNLFRLYDNLNHKILLIFYPKDYTPVCTKQLTDYRINKKIFDDLGINLVGINTGSVESHNSFTESCSLNFPVLSDPLKEVSSKYKALNFFGSNKLEAILGLRCIFILFEKDVLSFLYLSSGKLRDIFKGIS